MTPPIFQIVMAGLDPAIHAVPPMLTSEICTYVTPWMPGSSPGMTINSEDDRRHGATP